MRKKRNAELTGGDIRKGASDMTYDEIYNKMRDYEWAKQCLNLSLVKRGWNDAAVANCPHYSYLDFDVIPVLIFETDDRGHCTTNVTYCIADEWKVKEDYIFMRAMENVENSATIKTLADSLLRLCAGASVDYEPNETDYSTYIMSNQQFFFGGSQLLNKNAIVQFAQKVKSSVIIIPSSVHELILVPTNLYSEGELAIVMKRMNFGISDVNRNIVRKREWLSDHLYFLGRNSHGFWSLAGIEGGENSENGTS